MRIGWQELIALGIVIAVVGFSLYRRYRRPRGRAPGCCEADGQRNSDERPIHFYRRSGD